MEARLDVPAVAPDSLVAATAREAEAEPVSILLVDDQESNLLALQSVLEPLGQRLVPARSGDEALRLLLRQEFALILLDVRMPGLDGIETARFITSRERTRHVPIIFLTAHERDVGEVLSGYAAGAVDFVTKPFEPEVLRSKVAVFVELSRERARREAEASARAKAEAATATVRRLQGISDVALSHLDLDELLGELLQRSANLFGADTAGIALAPEPGARPLLSAVHGLEQLDSNVRVELASGLLHRVAARRRTISTPRLSGRDGLHASLLATGVRSLLAAPLTSGGVGFGVLYLGSLLADHFSDDDAALLHLSAERASFAIEHARRYQRERDLVELLQRSLLPERLPELPGLRMTARYVPSERVAQVGGDWYDAVGLADGRVAVAIGDVVGHGLKAAIVMAELRHALRAYALEGHSPAQALALVNAMVEATAGGGMAATVLLMTIDPSAGRVVLASAGHPPPLLLSADGTATWLEVGRCPPLGVADREHFNEVERELAPGDTIVLYTDGLIERRDATIDEGMERLRTLVAEGPHALEELCDTVLAAVESRGVYDDVALLAVRIPAVSAAHLQLRLHADPDAVTEARHRFAAWLQAHGADGEDVEDLALICSELAGNCVRHAYPDGERGDFDLGAELLDAQVQLEVRDYGHWRSPATPNGGLGLKIVRELADTVEVDRGAAGTRVRIVRRLAGSADDSTLAASSPA